MSRILQKSSNGQERITTLQIILGRYEAADQVFCIFLWKFGARFESWIDFSRIVFYTRVRREEDGT